jgi:pyruvate formate lyase activating enzyme
VRHRESTGVSNELILENLQDLSGRGHRIILRVPIIPGISDDEESILQMGAFAAGLPSLERVDLLPYHRIGRDKYPGLGKACPMPDAQPPSEERMEEIARTLRRFDLAVSVGG